MRFYVIAIKAHTNLVYNTLVHTIIYTDRKKAEKICKKLNAKLSYYDHTVMELIEVRDAS